MKPEKTKKAIILVLLILTVGLMAAFTVLSIMSVFYAN
ncbi:hypothetical protein BCL52_1661 [Salisediminibacterium halotolerans]|uniref:DUF4044 domain-containing protein n=1 Tax=Salisediminibacterium halotolerans TaxID=517425 RepID=A0A1H9WLL3_9BACI|nr:hypothetical protein BCL39_1664 [Actinophytocola xinjiangensis]RPE87531.1 hypothetical protein EDD67_1267 [Salisediminibacterium halotolerans]TWG35213.1 hypothetical protein BCL52_1661 [Salisediminibacterium halotolerans]SES34790.1 hypothetical protein SAMN05444126_1391 [Salisediminibacterium haloalkalitolerans]